MRRTEKWTVTLEYIAVEELVYDSISQFHTTTTMIARPNTENASEWVIFKEVCKDKAPPGLGANWTLPIKDYTRLAALFRLDVPKLWAVKQQVRELQQERAGRLLRRMFELSVRRQSSRDRHRYVRVQYWWKGIERPWYSPFVKITTNKLRDLDHNDAFVRLRRGQEGVLTMGQCQLNSWSGPSGDTCWWNNKELRTHSKDRVHNFREFLDYGRRNQSFLTETHYVTSADSDWHLAPGSQLNEFRGAATIFAEAEADEARYPKIFEKGSAPESESALAETCRGYASIDGLPARNGTEVTAWIDGVLSGTSTVFGGKGYYGPLLVRELVGESFEGKATVFLLVT